MMVSLRSEMRKMGKRIKTVIKVMRKRKKSCEKMEWDEFWLEERKGDRERGQNRKCDL